MDDGQITESNTGCKFAFGCAILILFLLAIGGPVLWAFLAEDLRGYGF